MNRRHHAVRCAKVASVWELGQSVVCTYESSDRWRKLGCGPVRSSPAVGKLSVSGIGMRSHTSVGIRIFAALARAGINVETISTSEVRVNVAVEGYKGQTALEVLRKEFADVQK